MNGGGTFPGRMDHFRPFLILLASLCRAVGLKSISESETVKKNKTQNWKDFLVLHLKNIKSGVCSLCSRLNSHRKFLAD